MLDIFSSEAFAGVLKRPPPDKNEAAAAAAAAVEEADDVLLLAADDIEDSDETVTFVGENVNSSMEESGTDMLL